MKHPLTATINSSCNAIGRALKEAGARSASARYYGSGDDSQINAVTIEWEGEPGAEPEGIEYHVPLHSLAEASPEGSLGDLRTADLSTAMADICEMAIKASGNDGYENDYGGGGLFTVLSDGSATLEHYDNAPTKEGTESCFEDEVNTPNLRIFADAMKASGISFIYVTYDGIGDSGEITDVSVKWADDSQETGQEPEQITYQTVAYKFDEASNRTVRIIESRTSNFKTAVEDFAEQLINAAGHNGYANNEGGSGEITITAEGKATVQHADNSLEHEDSYYTFNKTEPEAELASPEI